METPKEIADFSKKSFFEHLMHKQKELSRRQLEYRKMLSTKEHTREEKIAAKGFNSTMCQLQEEKDSLRAQIWVASGSVHQYTNKRSFAEIVCHLTCQEDLAEKIHTLKNNIANVQQVIGRVNKQIYELNRKTVPERQHQAYVTKIRKFVDILENQLALGAMRESAFTAINGELYEELLCLLQDRNNFNENYTKLVGKLNSEKKYIMELIEKAIETYDYSLDTYERMNNLSKRDEREFSILKVEMQNIACKNTAEGDDNKFFDRKGKYRHVADLQPKEYRRREAFRQEHQRRINLYKDVLEKVLDYCQTDDIREVVSKYQQQESIYYSFFNYANELGYHMTLLNNSVQRLYLEIRELKHTNHDLIQNQLETIRELENSLKKKTKQNTNWRKQTDRNEELLQKLLSGVQKIKDISGANTAPLTSLLGDNSSVNRNNVRNFLNILEKDIYKITACVYFLERHNSTVNPNDYLVRELEFNIEWPTPLEDIVLTQQCPECAEGDITLEEIELSVVEPMENVMKKISEKVHQPEMQYLLHNLSQCRLPRSRLLTAKREM